MSAAVPLTDGRHVAGTAPYAWPWDGDLDPRRLALIVAGADATWLGRSAAVGETAARIDAVAAVVRRSGGLVVHIAHDATGTGHPLPPTGGHEPTPRGATVDVTADLTVASGGIDGFYGSALDHRLRQAGRDHLLLAGFGLEGPVHSTLRSANDAGYECLLLTDASASLDPDCRDAAVSMVTMSGGIFGAVGTSTAFCHALLTDEPESP